MKYSSETEIKVYAYLHVDISALAARSLVPVQHTFYSDFFQENQLNSVPGVSQWGE